MAAKDTNDNWLLNFSVCVFLKRAVIKAGLSDKTEFKCSIMERVMQAYFEFSTVII